MVPTSLPQPYHQVVAFAVYAAMGHALDPAEIFASLTLFNILRYAPSRHR